MATQTLRVKGLREFQRACAKGDKESRTEVRKALKEAGEPVRRSAAQHFSPIDVRSAAGFRVVVRQRGVAVEQRIRRTTGQRPKYGSLQMRRALLPALMENEHEIERQTEIAIDRIADHFERKP